jgi:glycosyltransferase involved in cell wall biosynthesis
MSESNIKYQISHIANHELSQYRIAIIHDWLYGGGAEKVVLEMHEMFPDAPIYTSYCTDEWRQKLDGKVVTGYLQKWPFKSLRKFLPVLRQHWFASLDLSEYDLVISSSGNGEAKFALSSQKRSMKNEKSSAKRPLHVCYCHTPTHFYWRHYQQYLQSPGFRPYWLIRLALKVLVKPLRKRDYQAAQEVDYFIANSTHIQSDIKRYYDRESTVVHPPVDTVRFNQPSKSRQGFVTVGRQTPYKHIDILISACNQLNLPLTIIGRGPEHEHLQSLAGPTITFKTDLSDDEVARELASAEAFLFAAHEDFGIAPVEAMAAGTPVIAYKAGGALDYVIEGKTGTFFSEQSAESLIRVLQSFSPNQFDQITIKQAAKSFSAESFRHNLKSELERILKG